MKNDIENIVARIEASAIDIAPNYADWRDIGFAFADELGENGREYYHRISRFHPTYNHKDTDKQFSNCLKAKGHGITIKTLFHFAKQAGIKITNMSKCPNVQMSKCPNTHNENGESEPLLKIIPKNDTLDPEIENNEKETLPVIKEEIFQLLPNFLKQITNLANSREDADLLLLGSLIVTSACFPNVHGLYGGVTVYPNLFLFVTAQASAGKGRLALCRRLVEPIHRQLRNINKEEHEQYRQQKNEYSANKKNQEAEPPVEPPLRLLFVPANSTATAVFQTLNDNDGVGLIFETEGDTLAQTFKSEHGNYSDGFRKAFHHEKISYLRRKDREYVTLEVPKISVLLSGTPRQVQSLIPDAENGLFSRFIFYFMNLQLQWLDVFACNENESLDQQFDRFGKQFLDFHQTLKQYKNITFKLTEKQQKKFNQHFEKTQQHYWELLGNDYIGTVRRLGLTTFRIAMLLTVLRIMDSGEIATTLTCDDTDFRIAMEILEVLLQHAATVFKTWPTTANNQKNNANNNTNSSANSNTPNNNQKTILQKLLQKLLQNLPKQFNKADFTAAAKQLQIPESTANKQITRLLKSEQLQKLGHGKYEKNED